MTMINGTIIKVIRKIEWFRFNREQSPYKEPFWASYGS